MPEQVEHEDATHCLNKWRMRVSEDVVRLQDRMIKMNVSYFLCICIVSGLESRGLSKLFIVNAKGLLKLILHFFLTYSYFLHLHSFLSFL